jgi:hypothetical protein
MPFRRVLFFSFWIILFGSFYSTHYLLQKNWEPPLLIEPYILLALPVAYIGLWVWFAIYRKTEPELARLSVIFLFLFLFMVIWDGPITE